MRFFALIAALLMIFPGAARALDSAYQPLSPGASGAAGRRTPIVAAIERARPAVVSVYAQVNSAGSFRDPFHDEFFNRFFEDNWNRRRSRNNVVFGSGVIIDGARGIIATNEHVLRGASEVSVTLSDGREIPAKILGADRRFDLALLTINAPKSLPDLPLGDSETLMIGETVIAIGNPFGLSHSATTGVVSALGRTVPGDRDNEPLSDLIQTDASINPGNSGGPLVNINGEVVGINTAIYAQGEGLGFAIPSAQIKRIAASLLRGDQGGAGLDLGLELAASGRPVKGETGLLVVDLQRGGPADAAGLARGDLLMKLDGSATSTMAEYEMIVRSLAPDRAYAAEIVRDDRKFSAELRPRLLSEGEALDLALKFYGLKASESQGYLILEKPPRGSAAEALGLRAGDVLLSFGGAKLASLSDLAKAALAERSKSAVEISVQRGRTLYRTTIQRKGL